MGCNIHLRIERRKRVNPYPNDRHYWYNVGFDGEFRCRIYGMFARMAKVRDNYGNYKVQFEPRGLPDDLTDWATCESFYLYVTYNKEAAVYGERYCLKMDKKFLKANKFMLTDCEINKEILGNFSKIIEKAVVSVEEREKEELEMYKQISNETKLCRNIFTHLWNASRILYWEILDKEDHNKKL